MSKVLKTYEIECLQCRTVVEAQSASRKYCPPCAKYLKGQSSSRPKVFTRGGGLRSFELTCGHTKYFYQSPEIGEHLYCERCVDWILYHPEKKLTSGVTETCRNGHERTERNTARDSRGRKSCLVCRRGTDKEYRRRAKERAEP